MAGFNLRALITDVCNTSAIADPTTLAKEVRKRISKRDQRQALQQALPVVVMNVVARMRSTGSPLPSSGGQTSTDAQLRGAAGRSTKVAGIRSGWRAHLGDRLPVAPLQWKFLADCTASDLEFAANIRHEKALQLAASGDRYLALRDLLVEYAAETVADLPADVLDSMPAAGAA